MQTPIFWALAGLLAVQLVLAAALMALYPDPWPGITLCVLASATLGLLAWLFRPGPVHPASVRPWHNRTVKSDDSGNFPRAYDPCER